MTTDNSGAVTTSTAIIVQVLPVVPTVTATATYCQNATAATLTATGTALKWYATTTGGIGSTTTPIPATINVGTTNYYVSQTQNGSESARSMITVIVNALPVISQYSQVDGGTWNQISSSIVCASSTLVLGPQPALITGWTWSGPNGYSATTREIILTALATNKSGKYTATYTDGNSCKATGVYALTVNAAPSSPSVTATATYCQNGIATALSATGRGLLWYTAATGGTGSTTVPTASTATTGTTNYYVSQTAVGCESVRAMIAVTVNALPGATITAGSSTSIPQGGSVVLTASTGSSYKWFNGTTQVGTDASYTATAPGAYSVEVTNINNCFATSAATNVNLNSNQPSVITITSPTNSSSVKGPITITVTATNPAGTITKVEYLDGNTVIGTSTSVPYSFVWNKPTVGDHVITVRVTDSNGGITTSAPITVTSEVAVTGLFSSSSNSLNGVVYPNPANGAVFIDSDSDLSDASFMLVDVLGNEHNVSQTRTGLGAQIDVSNLSSGTYVLIIKKDGSVMRKKITVMK
jgi:hypothetical protein